MFTHQIIHLKESTMRDLPLLQADPSISEVIQEELKRQQDTIELIASENIVSKAVLEATGSILTNKYAEGYPGRRYYGGCDVVDKIERLAIQRAKELFNVNYANVQPHSGSQANFAVFLALLNPGDTVLGMSLNSGGHLTHGCKVSFSGKWFNAIGYDVNPETKLVDYQAIEDLALRHKPKLIIAGFSAYSRKIDFAKFREIADKVGAYLLADIAHVAGLIATGLYPSPFEHCDVVTTTTHKTLRGPRGGLILTNSAEIGKKINSAIFPGSQGGPLEHVIAGKAVAFKEALDPSFKTYMQAVVDNAKAAAEEFVNRGFNVVSGGTDNHLFIIDVSVLKLTGRMAEEALDSVNITCNKNSLPFDPLPPKETSGIRIGTPAITSRGFTKRDCVKVASLISDTLTALANNTLDAKREEIKAEVLELCRLHPIYNK